MLSYLGCISITLGDRSVYVAPKRQSALLRPLVEIAYNDARSIQFCFPKLAGGNSVSVESASSFEISVSES